MNRIFIILRKLLLVLIVIIGMALCACESDPILSPQVEVEEEAGGSYGNTNLSVNTTSNAENTTKDVKTGKIDSNRQKITNPKRF
ncbi:hypothetical protein C6501_00045 [Candidatus Poribacteria bacterium]|nr:MAG: hypothetical protein C6501_00045 [Candidatus Poribacteria bacterium]